jgi:3'-phosphoadenosine 5'-phosphosulfate sulfotransferase (PAPS reductase)/FAD synthetase
MRTPGDGDTIAVWFSSGAASAVAAKRTVERYGETCTVRVINNPIMEEDGDNKRFLYDVEKWIGIDVEFALNENFQTASAVAVWEKVKYMSGVAGAPCTNKLKREARQQWEARNHHDWLVMGFTADEKKRADMFQKTERSNFLPILVEEGITKADCYRIIQAAGIDLPRIYSMGYPNANCIGCVKATSPTYWNHVRKMHPGVFEDRAEQSRRIGARLVRHKGERIFLDELPESAKGQSMKTMDIECGLFCEERK